MKNENSIYAEILKKEKSAFVLNESKFIQNLNSFKSEFKKYYSNTMIGYSYKTNYIPRVCQLAHDVGCYAEVVSEMEVDMALINLKDKSHIIYNGPVKTKDSISKVIENGGIINIDNANDVLILDDILNRTSMKANVALRLNIDFDGNNSRFGMDKEDVQSVKKHLLASRKYNLIGFHLHLPFRSTDSFAFRVETMINVLQTHADIDVRYVNLGGGFFGNLGPSLSSALGVKNPPTYSDYAEIIGKTLYNYFSKRGKDTLPILFLEPGSSVVADVFTFISRVHTQKKINNRYYLVTYCGRHLVSPTNKTLMLPVSIGSSIEESMQDKNPEREYLVSGYTCIESDIIGKVIAPTKDTESLMVIIENVGSYSVVLGSDFILPQPAIYSISSNGNASLLKKGKKVEDILSEFEKIQE